MTSNLPRNIDNPVALDYIVVILIGIGILFMLLGNSVILKYRHYRPIKPKSVLLTVLSSLGGVIWIVAALVVNNHFPRRRGSFFAKCALWTYWLQACFGYALWLNCLTLRLIILYRIFILKRESCKYQFFILILLLLPTIIFSVCASTNPSIKFMESSSNAKGDCKFQKRSWAYGLIALLLFYFLVFFGFAFKLRNTMQQYNEFRLIQRGGTTSLFVFLLTLVTFQTSAYDKPVGRCFLSVAEAIAVFYYFWARNGEVIFNALFHQEDYERKFLADLARSPSDHDRETFPESFRNMEIRLRAVREDICQSKNRIRQLEEEIEALELQHGSLQQQMLPPTSLDGWSGFQHT